jgi:hypothetical protein
MGNSFTLFRGDDDTRYVVAPSGERLNKVRDGAATANSDDRSTLYKVEGSACGCDFLLVL